MLNSMKKYILYTLSILAATLVGGLIWLAIYDHVYTRASSSIEFDGPAGGILVLSLLLAAIVTAVTAGILLRRRHKSNIFRLVCIAVPSVLVAVTVVGAFFARYSISHYGSGLTIDCHMDVGPVNNIGDIQDTNAYHVCP
jgi:hypothetical protein